MPTIAETDTPARDALTVPRLTREDIATALDVAVSTVEAYASTGAAHRPIPPDRRRRYAALLYRFAAEVERLAGEELARANTLPVGLDPTQLNV